MKYSIICFVWLCTDTRVSNMGTDVIITVTNSVNRIVSKKTMTFPSFRIARSYARHLQLSWDELRDLFPDSIMSIHLIKKEVKKDV